MQRSRSSSDVPDAIVHAIIITISTHCVSTPDFSLIFLARLPHHQAVRIILIGYQG